MSVRPDIVSTIYDLETILTTKIFQHRCMELEDDMKLRMKRLGYICKKMFLIHFVK